MHEYAVLFPYYGDAPKDVLSQNFRCVQRLNPGVPVIPLIHDGIPVLDGSVDLRGESSAWNDTNKWRGCDAMIYRWFPRRTVDARRYIIYEWDTYATAGIPEFYAPVWDADLAALHCFTQREEPSWWWFREVDRLGDLAPWASGVTPFSGTLLSASALEAICAAPVLHDTFCELRLGTMASFAGVKLTSMPFARGFIDCAPERIFPFSGQRGIYHPVKHLVPPSPAAAPPAPTPPPAPPPPPVVDGATQARIDDRRRLLAQAPLGSRTDIINLLSRAMDLDRYLEIGVADGHNFSQVVARQRHGVDPAVATTFSMTSDAFFAAGHGLEQYDLVFVDGFHEAAQCLRDIENALARLAPHGFVVVHDVNPPTEWHQRPPSEFVSGTEWNGTVWQAIVQLRQRRPDLRVVTVDVDWGCGVIWRPRTGEAPRLPATDGDLPLTWAELERHRRTWLNLVTTDELRAILRDELG